MLKNYLCHVVISSIFAISTIDTWGMKQNWSKNSSSRKTTEKLSRPKVIMPHKTQLNTSGKDNPQQKKATSYVTATISMATHISSDTSNYSDDDCDTVKKQYEENNTLAISSTDTCGLVRSRHINLQSKYDEDILLTEINQQQSSDDSSDDYETELRQQQFEKTTREDVICAFIKGETISQNALQYFASPDVFYDNALKFVKLSEPPTNELLQNIAEYISKQSTLNAAIDITIPQSGSFHQHTRRSDINSFLLYRSFDVLDILHQEIMINICTKICDRIVSFTIFINPDETKKLSSAIRKSQKTNNNPIDACKIINSWQILLLKQTLKNEESQLADLGEYLEEIYPETDRSFIDTCLTKYQHALWSAFYTIGFSTHYAVTAQNQAKSAITNIFMLPRESQNLSQLKQMQNFMNQTKNFASILTKSPKEITDLWNVIAGLQSSQAVRFQLFVQSID
ncbi:MAG: hypothetical protein E7015_03095 [Alphaproteobacteria bacterium]|nr:hypothetical protein [Alphaproteobacteria bacterium]